MIERKGRASSSLAGGLQRVTRRGWRTLFAVLVALSLLALLMTYTNVDNDEYKARFSKLFSKDGKSRNGSLIPTKIWQIFLAKGKPNENPPIEPDTLRDTASWLALNADYTYTLIGQKGGNEFVSRHFGHDDRIMETYSNLANVGMKSDLLRYLVLDIEGGVYTDTDTEALKPIDDWVPADLRDQVRLIVGVEFDRRNGGAWADIPHWLQFCQWTIAAAPGHPVFRKMVDRVLESVEGLSKSYDKPLNELHPGSFDVMNSTGPAAWTDVVFAQLQEYEPSLNETKDLSFMLGPKLYGDILVLNIDGFGTAQPHSGSTNDGSISDLALMKHNFRGSWRGDD